MNADAAANLQEQKRTFNHSHKKGNGVSLPFRLQRLANSEVRTEHIPLDALRELSVSVVRLSCRPVICWMPAKCLRRPPFPCRSRTRSLCFATQTKSDPAILHWRRNTYCVCTAGLLTLETAYGQRRKRQQRNRFLFGAKKKKSSERFGG